MKALTETPLFPAEGPPVLTVGQLTAEIKELVEAGFAQVWVVGEISSLTRASSGHIYLSLQEKNVAVLRSVIWRSTALRLPFLPEEGMEVIARGRISVYPPRGDYQLVIDELHPKGQGAAELALRKLKEKLAKFGYFAPERKKPLPRFPRRLALVTSPSGAAIRDMLEILIRRWPCGEVLVCPVRVQGIGAGQEIAHALQQVNELSDIDVILLGRGGGSAEDLAAFNDEEVAHAIFRSRIPIIAAIGHEIDVTIADLVADRRALTPSEAAELATPDCRDLSQALQQRQHRLSDLLRRQLDRWKKSLDNIEQRRIFQYPLERLRELERRLDDVQETLRRAIKLDVQRRQQQMQANAGRLEALSPLQVLARGYSLTRIEPGHRLVHSASQVQPGDNLEIRVHDGRILAQTTRVESVRRELTENEQAH